MRTSRAAAIATACAVVAALLTAAPANADAVRWSHLDGRDSGKLASGLSSWVDESNLKRTSDLTTESWWGNDSSWNRYSYVRNQPLNAIDPTGMWTATVDTATGTAWGVAEAGDTLSDLAAQITGDASKWTSLGFTEDQANALQVGQQVDISPMLHPSIVSALQRQAVADAAGNFSPYRDSSGALTATNPPNCWATASEAIGATVPGWTKGAYMSQSQANQVLTGLGQPVATARGGAFVRYGTSATGADLQHFAIGLVTSSAGEVYVFSQEGYGSAYRITTSSNLSGPTYPYGSDVSFYR